MNIGITGNSGAGKSSFINAIRGLDNDDEKAAKVGVTETTLEPKCYDHPTNSKIKYWDLPGIGTPKYPDLETYCRKVQLERYSAFLVFTIDRFTENDQKLAKKIQSTDRSFFFIRAKLIKMFSLRSVSGHSMKMPCYRKSDATLWKIW
ncbi:Interferon-inducible GTPase 5-like [Desmophyllum pertusum]|uniref:Interferon-inducible GTPase 5-like n=1 Tax=Desmophyllum pertusum TaxID=174260 RepID=A0A9X0D5J6_9CNID|nr:Interferon-inducible GTPase 5-like [Desmophyllum pertusum]